MQPEVKLTEAAVNLLRCPACKARLELDNDQFKCTDISCCAVFPVVNHIPVLINENGSVFRIDDFRNERDTFFKYSKHGKIGQLLKRLNPTITKNLACKENYQKLRDLLLDMTDKPRVLVVGGSILGKGMESLVAEQAIELVESDVAFGPRAALICDAHDIPFEDDSFDGIIVQAVLEHVVDPQRCADEFYRVLKPGGILYAETAFMQQIHGGRMTLCGSPNWDTGGCSGTSRRLIVELLVDQE